MKNLFLVVFIFFVSVVFSQEKNKTDINGKKQGVWQKNYPSGEIRYIGQFKDDIPHGIFKHYYETGELNIEMNHFGDVSYANFYYTTGELQAIGKYVNKQKDSSWVYFHKNGQKMSNDIYINGKRQGTWITYYNDGSIAEEKNYLQDFEEGEWKQYYQNGQLKMKATFRQGSVEGEQYYYDASGNITIIGNLFHGVRHGSWIYYNSDGTIKKKEQYFKGQRVDENKDDDLIKDDTLNREKRDVLEYEDFIPSR